MAKYGMIIDCTKCTGCYNCFLTCQDEFCGNDYPGYAVGVPMSGHSWIRVVDKERGKYPKVKVAYTPITCMHCQNPACVEACPEQDAIYKRPDGIVLINREKCTGCGLCMPACPYGVIHLNNKEHVAEKCTFCSHRIDQGLLPFCIEECVCGAIHIGDIADSSSQLSLLLSSRKGYTLELGKDTQPSNYYLAP